jgi:hypothetical protein
VIAQAKILPITQTVLSNLYQQFVAKDVSSIKGIPNSDFMTMSLWFERPASGKNGFDRSPKLKELLSGKFNMGYSHW